MLKALLCEVNKSQTRNFAGQGFRVNYEKPKYLGETYFFNLYVPQPCRVNFSNLALSQLPKPYYIHFQPKYFGKSKLERLMNMRLSLSDSIFLAKNTL